MRLSGKNYQCAQLIQAIKDRLIQINRNPSPPDRPDQSMAHLFASLAGLFSQYAQLQDYKPLPIVAYSQASGAELWREWIHLSNQLNFFASLEQQWQILPKLIGLCQRLSQLLRPVGDSNPFLKSMIGASVHSFLAQLVDYWNQADLHQFASMQFFANASMPELEQWMRYFTDPDFLLLFNQLFIYRSSPGLLFDLSLSAEKLISIRSRLDFIYRYLELLQQQLQASLKAHGLDAFTDLLLHGDELPVGVKIIRQDYLREPILMAVQRMKIKSAAVKGQETSLDQVRNMILAYKFWFNPDRLIDAIMVLNQQWERELGQALDETEFQDRMGMLLAQSSTSDCLDLYGYFSNKDTRYLMLTLGAVITGQAMDWPRQFSESDRGLLAKIARLLNWTSRALRQILAKRQVDTQEYAFEQADLTQRLQPGQRNQNAIERALNLYANDEGRSGRSIDELFSLFER